MCSNAFFPRHDWADIRSSTSDWSGDIFLAFFWDFFFKCDFSIDLFRELDLSRCLFLELDFPDDFLDFFLDFFLECFDFLCLLRDGEEESSFSFSSPLSSSADDLSSSESSSLLFAMLRSFLFFG